MGKKYDWKSKGAEVDEVLDDEPAAPQQAEKSNLCPVCELCGERHELRVELMNWICPRCSYQEPRQQNAGA